MSLNLTGVNARKATIYDIELLTGTVLRLTDYGGTYTKLPPVSGNTYVPIYIKRGAVGSNTNLQSDAVKVTFGATAFDISGVSIISAVKYGWFDDAEVCITEIDPRNVTDTRHVFRGNVTKGIKHNRKEVTLKLASIMDMVNETVPKCLYQEQCNHQLFSTYCGLVKATYQQAGTVLAGSTNIKIYANEFLFAAHAEGYWELGEFVFSSGNNNNLRRTVRTHGDGYVELYRAFNLDVAEGDTFLAYPGCDKSGETCNDKFSNIDNFLGFEFVPFPEVLYQ